MCDLRQNPSKLMAGYSHHHRNLQHFFPLEKLLCSIGQEDAVHHSSQVKFHLNTTQDLLLIISNQTFWCLFSSQECSQAAILWPKAAGTKQHFNSFLPVTFLILCSPSVAVLHALINTSTVKDLQKFSSHNSVE